MIKFQSVIKQSFILIVTALTLGAALVSAQQGTGSLGGVVTDELGGVLIGASVTVTDARGVVKTTVTNNEGRYAFSGLQPGQYSLRVENKGFKPFEKMDVGLRAGRTETLDISMGILLETESVSVDSANNSLNTSPDNSAAGIVLTGRDLDILADDPDQLMEDLRNLGATTGGPDAVQLYVDGFSNARIPSKSSIREVRINANPFGADQENFGLNRVDIITKPGTDKWHGQALLNFNDESFNARDTFSPNRAPYQSRLYSGSLSGPLASRKAAFFFDIERRDIDENAVIAATILDPSLNFVSFQQAIATPQRRTSVSGRVDYQLNQNHTLVARYNYGRSNQQNSGIGGFFLASRALDFSSTDHVFQLTETAIISPSHLNETRFQYVRSSYGQRGDNSLPAINVQEAFVGGGASVGLTSNEVDRFDLLNSSILTFGRHTVKVGGRIRGVRLVDVSNSNFNGTFIFSSLADYRQTLLGVPGARPAQFTIATGNPQAQASRVDFGAFVQDDWQARPNLTLSFGVRYETQTNINDKIDIAPRLAFAWAPGTTAGNSRPKMVIRGGAGIFYDRFREEFTLDANRFNGVNQQQFIIDAPDFFPFVPTPEALAGAVRSQSVRRVADDLQSRYSMKGTLSIERQLPRNTTLSIAYVYERDIHGLSGRNINAPLPGTFRPDVEGSGVRPFGDIGNIFVFESIGRKSDNTLSFYINSRPHPRLTAFALIGFSRETGDILGPYGYPANPYDFGPEYGRVTGDVRAFINIGANLNGPWGLAFNALIRARSENRFNITTGRDTNGDGVFFDRPAFATDLSKPGVIVTRFGAFDPNPEPGQPIIPRNYGVGPRFFLVNLRVSKSFSFDTIGSEVKGNQNKAAAAAKRFNLNFSIQVQNLLNHTNFGSFIGNLNSPLFGQANTASIPRRIDAGVRLSF
ncbi:MAG TPA: carboxypeptidase regulatory-like domain-containing protein [Pyrinomonadaceae bacterium]|nr:carboxypeptidase regulatory-like domain-containing protein [Pyrinomonadaceae bacterium]